MSYSNNGWTGEQLDEVKKEHYGKGAETKATTITRVNGTLYQARELASEVCELVDMFLGPEPPAPSAMSDDYKDSPEKTSGIFSEMDENSGDTKAIMDRAFQALKRLRSSV